MTSKGESNRSASSKVSVSELFDLLPDGILAELSDQTNVDHQVSKLNGRVMFQLLIFGVLEEERLSNRVLAALFSSEKFRLFAGKEIEQTAHSSIAERLSHINVDFFEKVFSEFVARSQRRYRRYLDSHTDLLRFDSTMISVGAGLVKMGMQVGRKPRKTKGKKYIKVSIGQSGALPAEVQVFVNQSHLSEEVALGEMVDKSKEKKDKVVVFDRGLKGRKTLGSYSEGGIKFVTRGGHNLKYEVVRSHDNVQGRSTETLDLEQDSIVHLFGDGGKKTKELFRLVIARRKSNGLLIYFLTNILDVTAEEVTEIYKRRWDIEVFFRFIKQELGFENLISLNENGIKVMVYIRLIAATMLEIYRLANKNDGYKISKLKFKQELQMEIFRAMLTLAGGDLTALDRNLIDYKGIF
jgi:hypothetical protein